MLKLYHQVGHNSNWNIDSFTDDICGDGLILSPVHQSIEVIDQLEESVKRKSVFDPQYYLPNSQKRKLASYPFFPEIISSGFSTHDFPLVALESARKCVAFQVDQGFEKIIIPTRYIDQLATNYIEQQEEYSVHPFLTAIEEIGGDKPIFLTLSLTSHMVIDAGFRTRLLNWVTSFPDISGIYILVSHERQTKQIQDGNFLFSYLEFLSALASTGLGLIIGHTNTESLLYSLIDGATLTFGSFENTRIFSIDKFLETEEERRGPKARIYVPGLLNWIQYGHAVDVRNASPDLWSRVYTPTKYGDQELVRATEPHFSQPGLYKHHFLCFSEQIRKLSELDVAGRYNIVRAWIMEAIGNHQAVARLPIDLDSHGNGEHLQPWLDCLNRYYRQYIRPAAL